MDTNLTSIGTNILTALLTIFSSVIIFLITLLVKKWLKERKGDIWTNFLKSDKYVSECIQQYEKIESPELSKMVIEEVIGILFGFGLFFSILINLTLYFGKNWFAFALLTLIIFFISFILASVISWRIDKRIKDKTLLKDSEKTARTIIFANWIIITGFLSVLYFIYFLLKNHNLTIQSLTSFDGNVFALSFIFLLLAVYLSITNRKDLLKHVKNLLNEQYSKQDVERTFPEIRIKTKSMDLEGKLFDIFDDNLIILDIHGIKNAVEWDSITFMELKKYTQN